MVVATSSKNAIVTLNNDQKSQIESKFEKYTLAEFLKLNVDDKGVDTSTGLRTDDLVIDKDTTY